MHLREFGFRMSPSADGLQRWKRHLQFRTVEELEQAAMYYTGNQDVYASMACYWNPASHDMGTKRLIYADLSFDLDLDHMPDLLRRFVLEEGDISEQEAIEHVQMRTIQLRDSLIDEFGVSKHDITEVFSGGRGFHLHVRDDDYCYRLSDNTRYRHCQEARREIMDYLSAKHDIHADKTVTPDLHRMLRVPGSIHSKSGLMCQVVDLDTFDVGEVLHGAG